MLVEAMFRRRFTSGRAQRYSNISVYAIQETFIA